jgi:NADH-quinone oxidoreductase subunit H
MIDWSLVIFTLVKIVVVFACVMLCVAYLTWIERKVIAHMQIRMGPMYAGWHGLLQPIADGIKLFFKEDIMPKMANKVLFILAPTISIIPAIMSFAVIPFGDYTTFFGLLKNPEPMRIAELNIGILYIFALAGLGSYGVVFGGWSANNKYALMGALRGSAQMISYELALTLSVIGVVMITGSLNLVEIVNAQKHVWNIVYQPVAFVLYIICGIAELNRTPFDMPEAESELVAGFHADYSSMKFAMFFMAEYANMITIASLATTLFLGGWHGPFLPPLVWFIIKVFILIFFFIWVRATYPRVRFDQLMKLGWKVLVPIALANIFVTGLVMMILN